MATNFLNDGKVRELILASYASKAWTKLESSNICSKCGDPVSTESIRKDLSLQDLVSNKNLSSGTTTLNQSDERPRMNISRYLFLLFWIFFFPFMVLNKLVNSEILLRHFARKKTKRKRNG